MIRDKFYVRKAFGWHGPFDTYADANLWALGNGLGAFEAAASIFQGGDAEVIQAGHQVRAGRAIAAHDRSRSAGLRVAR